MNEPIKFLFFLALVAGILRLGWSQPLRYLTLSQQQIEQIEHPKPAPTPRSNWMWDPARRTSLDPKRYP